MKKTRKAFVITILILFTGSLNVVLSPIPAFPDETAKAVFQNSCATCHGPGGKGDGIVTASLPVKPRDFTDCKEMVTVSDDAITKVIKSGGQSAGLSPLMPPFGGALSDQQISGLVDFIRGFCKK